MNILSTLSNVNYLGVLVATVAAFIFGMIWYGPLFGKKWMALMGVAAGSPKTGMVKAMVFGLCMTFIGATIVAMFTGGAGVKEGMTLGVVLGLFIMVSMLSGATYEQKSLTYKMISAGYILLVWTIVGGVVSYF